MNLEAMQITSTISVANITQWISQSDKLVWSVLKNRLVYPTQWTGHLTQWTDQSDTVDRSTSHSGLANLTQ